MTKKANNIYGEFTRKVDEYVNFYKNTKEDLPFIIEQIKGIYGYFEKMIDGMCRFDLLNESDHTVLYGRSFDYCKKAIETVKSI